MRHRGCWARLTLVLGWCAALASCAAPDTAGSHLRRARADANAARTAEAEAGFRRALALTEAEPGPSIERAHAVYGLGELYLSFPFLERSGEAVPLLRRAVAEYEAALGDDHPAVGIVWTQLARERQEAGDEETAAEFQARAGEIFRASLPPDHALLRLHRTGYPLVHPDEIALVRFPPPAAQPKAPEPSAPPPDASQRSTDEGELAAVVDASGTYLRPNVQLADGSVGYMHVRPEDMPWIVSIGTPRAPPKYGSSAKAREVAIEAMRMWEDAIRPHLPWFELRFVEEDPLAHVQVEWKRRVTGPWAGFGGQRWSERDGMLLVGGYMEVSTTPGRFQTLKLDEVRLLVAHEFGHVLGLGHCLDCDSAMNYAWHTRGRVVVTETDVRTFLALVAQPIALPH